MFKKPPQSGMSLINVLVAVMIIIIAFIGIWNLFNFGLRIIADNKYRVVASAIANEKIETIHNLPYNQIGTVGGGICCGTDCPETSNCSLPQIETINRSGSNFIASTSIIYIDDPYDNLAPADPIANDYKKIKIEVDWPSRVFGQSVVSYTNISPKGVENNEGGGIIRVIVFDASGQPVPDVNVQIVNNTFTPPTNFSYPTDQNGILLIPGLAPAVKSYEIAVSKPDYSSDKTYPEAPPELPELLEPTKPHLTVLESQITEISFTIDVLGSLNITTISKNYAPNWLINVASTEAEEVNPDVCADNNNDYYFVWQDDKDTGSGVYKIYAQKYNNNLEAVWSEDKRIFDANNQANPRLDTDGVNLYIAWNDDRSGNQDSYLIKLDADGNDLWGGDKKIENQNPNSDQTYPDVNVADIANEIFITFQENSGLNNNWDIYWQKYDANGNFLLAPAIKVNDDATDKNQNFPQIVFYNDSVNNDKVAYIVWQDYRNDNWDIYAQKYNATGTPLWTNNLKLNTDTGETSQTAPKITADSNANLYIVWQDNRNVNWDIYVHKYNPNGAPAWPNEIKINSDSGSANQTAPTIAIDSSNQAYVSWTDDRNFDTQGLDIYTQKIAEDGNKLWVEDERMIYSDSNGADQKNSSLTVDNNGYAIFAWQDDRNPANDTDIYAARYQKPGDPIILPNVPITVRGAKKIYNTPIIYKFDNNYTTNVSGQLNLPNIEWDTYTIIPQATSTYTFIASDPPSPLILNPGQPLEVKLNLE